VRAQEEANRAYFRDYEEIVSDALGRMRRYWTCGAGMFSFFG
jgi:hypothetical protein